MLTLTTRQREAFIVLLPQVEEALEIFGGASIAPGSFRGDLSRLRNRLPELRHHLGKPEALSRKDLEAVHQIAQPVGIFLKCQFDIGVLMSASQQAIRPDGDLPTPDAVRVMAKSRELLTAWSQACLPLCRMIHPETFEPDPVEQANWHYSGKMGIA